MGRVSFGKEEKITCIVDVSLKGGDGDALCLAYKTTRRDFIGPIYLTNDGYVLRFKEANLSYYPMPEGEELAELQAAGLLPSPLPPYKIPLYEYAFGYLMEIIFGGMILWSGLKLLFKRDPAPALPEGSGSSTGPGPIG